MTKRQQRRLEEHIQNATASLHGVESLLAGLSLETAVARVTKPVPHLVIIGLRAELGEVRRYLSKAGAILWPPQGEGDG